MNSHSRQPAPWPVWIGLTVAFVTVGYPVLMIFLQSVAPNFSGDRDAGLFAPFRELTKTPGIAQMWITSLNCAAVTTLLSWLLGLPAGWLLARVNLPGKTFFRVSLLLPVMSPPYLLALAYVLVFQKQGLFDSFVFSLPESVRNLFFSFWGVVFVMSLTSFGTVALLVEASLQGISTRLEDAARCLNAPPWSIFQRITLPLLIPALLNSGILVFVDTLSNFGVAAVLGPRSDLLLLPTAIYEMLTTWPVDVPLAAALSALLAVTAMLLVTVSRFVIGSKVFTNGRLPANNLIKLKFSHKSWVFLFFGGLFLFSALIPNFTVFLMSIIERWQGGRPTFTIKHYQSLLSWGSGGSEALATSCLLSLAAATACVAIGGLVAYALSRFRGLGATLLDYLSLLPRVIPNLVIAVAMILAWNAPWLPFRIYGTVGILILAYVGIYQAIALRFGDAAMQLLAPRLEHAASCLRAPRHSILTRIVFPMMAPSLFVAWITIFIMCLRDWVASIMLLPPGVQTVGSYIFSQFEQGDFSQAMSMSVCTVVLSSGLLVIANIRFYQKTIFPT